MIEWHGRFCRFADVYFGEEPPPARGDFVRDLHRLTPSPAMRCTLSHTILIDLDREPAAIMADVSKNTRYKIRRAEQGDQVRYETRNDGAAAVAEFSEFYGRFAALKKLPPVPAGYLAALVRARALDLSVVRDDTTTLVWHAHYRGRQRVRLLYSASLYRADGDSGHRSLVGRANRYHHWRDMLRFREEGITLYDFGGWYDGDADLERLRINAFKEEFGGRVARTFTGQRAVTMKARLLLALQQAAIRAGTVTGRAA
jgi:GNAT acetyltransferase-like protein